MYYVADSHSLVWYLTDDKKLGQKALNLFLKADNGEAIIIVPTIVLAEIIYICERKKANLEIKDVINKIKHSLNYLSYNLDIETLEKVISLKSLSELHDRIVVAIAKLLDATLITKDQQIIDSNFVKTIW